MTSPQPPSALPKPECFYHKFSGGQQCQNVAVFVSCGLHNIVDGWTWCLDHPPAKEFRALLAQVNHV